MSKSSSFEREQLASTAAMTRLSLPLLPSPLCRHRPIKVLSSFNSNVVFVVVFSLSVPLPPVSQTPDFIREQLDDTHSNYDRKLKAFQPTLYPFLPLANPQTLLRLRPSNVQHLYNHLRTALAHPGPNTCTSINFSYFQVQPLFTSVIIQTSIIQSTIITNPPFQHNSSTNIGAIVGGVVGGVVGLAILTLLTILLIRRHRRNREKYLFNGNFDPAHVVPTTPRISLPDDGYDGMGGRLGTGVGGVVMPFQYVPEHEGRQEMRTADLGVGAGAGAGAAGIGAAYAMSQSQHGHGNGNGYGHGTYTPSMSPSDPGSGSGSAYFPNPFASAVSSLEAGSASSCTRSASVSGHGTALSNSVSGTKTASVIAKEREAFGGSVRGGISLANHDSDGAGGSGVGRNGAGAGRPLIVHSHGGRVVREVHEEVAEGTPPTYDSILANERR
ncbi:hypothetical protein H2248_002335 [Termitomyces sp. 'cryptogamus']|nr:hypothetical protein H2248_002335 [Termitomyces sp. 'cryptogamus']